MEVREEGWKSVVEGSVRSQPSRLNAHKSMSPVGFFGLWALI